MNCNEEYIKLLEIVKKSMKETDNTKAETAIAKKLGKNTSFITDKKKSVKGYSAEDVLWLRYTFRDILGFPINESKKEDFKSEVQGVNSGRKEESFSSVLQSIALAQQELADQLKNLSAAVESISAEGLDRILEKIPPGKNSVEKKGKQGT